MPRLILINGPPACGKSTMARMYAAGHPLTLVLDIDRVRGCLGRWREDLPSASRAARAIALAAARAHLRAGHDVVVPQLLGRPDFLVGLEHAARDTGAGFAEIVLLAGKDEMLRAFADRAASARPADIAAHDLAGHAGGDADLAAMHDRLTALLATRPGAMIVPVTRGQPGLTYAAMLAALDGRPGPAPTPRDREPRGTLSEIHPKRRFSAPRRGTAPHGRPGAGPPVLRALVHDRHRSDEYGWITRSRGSADDLREQGSHDARGGRTAEVP